MPEQKYRVRALSVTGPDGERLTLADLPPAGMKRWLARHKAMVLAAVQQGLISFGEVCERYELSVDEYLTWQRSFDRKRVPGLRAKWSKGD